MFSWGCVNIFFHEQLAEEDFGQIGRIAFKKRNRLLEETLYVLECVSPGLGYEEHNRECRTSFV